MVDLATAELVTPRIREKTPHPSTPAAVLQTVASVVKQVLAEHGTVKGLAIGCGLPAPLRKRPSRLRPNPNLPTWCRRPADVDATFSRPAIDRNRYEKE